MATEVFFPTVVVSLNNINKTVTSVSCSTGSKSAFATASIDFDITEGRPYPGDRVEIYAGYGATRSLVFSGEVDDEGVDLWPNKTSVSCSGFLGRTQRTVGTPTLPGEDFDGVTITYGTCADAPSADPSGAPDSAATPAYRFCAMTDKAIIEEILKIYGIADMNISAYTPSTIFGNITPINVLNSDDGWKVIQSLDEVTGFRTYDSPDGTVVRSSYSELPGSGGKILSEGFDLAGGKTSRSRRTVVNRVTCQGSQDVLDTQGIPISIRAARQLPSPVNPNTHLPIIPTPPTYQSKDFSSNLIETFALADSYCARVLGELCRVIETISIELDKGDQTIYPGMTVQLNSSHLGMTGANAWFVEQVDHKLDNGGFHTTLSLLGSSTDAGTSPFKPPIALFTWRGEQEHLSDGSTLTVIYCDGTDSYDPDSAVSGAPPGPSGSALPVVSSAPGGSGGGFVSDVYRGIAGYHWSSNFGTPKIGTAHDSSRATFVSTMALPADAWVELYVIDADQGAPSTPLRKTIKDSERTPLLVRDIISAEGTRLSISRDGQLTWKDINIPAVGTCEVGAADYTFAWTADGTFYKVDGLNTYTQMQPIGVTAASIHWDDKNPDKPDGRCWAGGSNGEVWMSIDNGLTWTEKAPVPNGMPIRAIEESPFLNGDIYAIAGNTYYHSFSEATAGADGVAWSVESSHPNTALEATRMTSGFGKGFYALAGSAPASGTEVSRLLERESKVAGNWDAEFRPVTITGLTYAVYRDALVLTDIAPDGTTGRTWVTPAGSNFSFSATGSPSAGPGTGVMKVYDQTFGAPRHIIRDGYFAGVIYGTADNALFKTVDEYDSILKMKQLGDGGSHGCMIGYGGMHRVVQPGRLIATLWKTTSSTTVDADNIIAELSSTGWTKLSDSPLVAADLFGGAFGAGGDARRRLRKVDSNTFITWMVAYGFALSVNPAVTNAAVSFDRCKTWQTLPITGMLDFTITVDGRLYAVVLNGTQIWRTTTDYFTWEVVYAHRPDASDSEGAFNQIRWSGICADEENPAIFLLKTNGGVIQTNADFTDAPFQSGNQPRNYTFGHGDQAGVPQRNAMTVVPGRTNNFPLHHKRPGTHVPHTKRC
jgi:hypothetical protein